MSTLSASTCKFAQLSSRSMNDPCEPMTNLYSFGLIPHVLNSIIIRLKKSRNKIMDPNHQ